MGRQGVSAGEIPRGAAGTGAVRAARARRLSRTHLVQLLDVAEVRVRDEDLPADGAREAEQRRLAEHAQALCVWGEGCC